MLLRIRQEKDNLYSTSMKCRNPDRYVSASFDLSSNKQKIKSKFEEDIIGPFASNFSLSATFQTKSEPDLRSFKDLVSIFPGLSGLKINLNEPLNKVNYFEVNELSCQIGNIKFGKNKSTDEISLEFWYSLDKASGQPPLIVEFTFDFGAVEIDNVNKSDRKLLLEKFPISLVKNANAFYYSLQDNKEFIGSETAKTKTPFS
jgi:hypothetical protein